MLLCRRGYKNHTFHPAPKTTRNASQNVTKMVPKAGNSSSGGLLENIAKTNAQNNGKVTQNRPRGVSHERGFRLQSASGRAWGPAGLQDHPPKLLKPPQTVIFADFRASGRELPSNFFNNSGDFGNEISTTRVL